MVVYEVRGEKIKLAIDHKKKIYATFIIESYEDAEEYVYIDPEEILKLADQIKNLKDKHYKAARDKEIDHIAYNILEAIPVEE
ncbi:hypothetical protein Smar_1435 [Staphylothermus marinus F1]|uniref:Uncharacterized protein n=1 Tax=Staphylothermus marinus (strain ATCC 43588 / DSM 3639 / JCM 9404 / F1) TaxID=399550 RepID=A3DPG5_STAMF|nr:hypothetical protein [Staphylothermus marinus]ABN70525.1 hypothetical protein Smar_1435 [Staphylothermus marinus F1]